MAHPIATHDTAGTQTTRERAEIAEAAALTGSPWLAYMARYAEPAMTPDAWTDAVNRARRDIRMYGSTATPVTGRA